MSKKTRDIPPIHPGEILREEFLTPLGVTPYRLAKEIGVDPTAIKEILDGQRAITAQMALRFGRFFGTTPDFWAGLQTQYELDMAADQVAAKLAKIVPLKSAA
jgi:addiction module HigA family antidote